VILFPSKATWPQQIITNTVSRNFLQPSLLPRVHALHRRKTLNPPYIKPLDKITKRLQNRASKTLPGLSSQMATPATRMMLFKNGKSFPLHLLRGSLLNGSNNITSQFMISDPALFQPQQKPIFNLLGGLSNAGLVSDINGALNWRFGRFGEMGRVEARGKSERVISDEDEEDDEDVDDDDEEIEDFDEDVEYEDGGDFDDDDDDDEDDRKWK